MTKHSGAAAVLPPGAAAAITAPPDALTFLKNEHKEVAALFRLYDYGKNRLPPAKKQELAEKVCRALKTHAILEEEIFYPAVEDHLGDALPLVAEARAEQNTFKQLITEIEYGMPGSIAYDADMKVLDGYVAMHVADEERALFVQVERSGLDIKALGAQLMKRKKQLSAQGDEGFRKDCGDELLGGGFAG